jgi:SAM-dependent methyltransferase
LVRAEERIAAHPELRAARGSGRIELHVGDVRLVRRTDRFGLAILAGVISHLDGPEDGLRALMSAGRLLDDDGVLVVDTLGPGGLPRHDLPLSIDWERDFGSGRVVRRSSLERRDTPEGVRVAYATLTDVTRADGTIARLPASFRLWYPSAATIEALAVEAELAVEAMYGSHELDPLVEDSERCIVVLRPAQHDPGTG